MLCAERPLGRALCISWPFLITDWSAEASTAALAALPAATSWD